MKKQYTVMSVIILLSRYMYCLFEAYLTYKTLRTCEPLGPRSWLAIFRQEWFFYTVLQVSAAVLLRNLNIRRVTWVYAVAVVIYKSIIFVERASYQSTHIDAEKILETIVRRQC